MNIPQKPVSFMWFVAKRSRKWAIFAFIAVTFAQLLEGAFLLVLRELTDSATMAVAHGFQENLLNVLWFWALILPLLYLLIENVWRISGLSGMRLITEGEKTVSSELFRYLVYHSRSYFNSKFAGALVNKIGNATRGVHNMFANTLWQFYPLFIGLIIDVVIVFSINKMLSLMFVVWIIVFLSFNFYLVRKKQPLSFAVAKAGSESKGKMVDTVSNIATVHAIASHRYELKFVGGFIEKYRKKHLESWMASELILFINGVLLSIFVFGMVAGTILAMKIFQTTLGSLVLIISMTVNLTQSLFFIGHKMTDAMDDYSQIEEGLSELVIPYAITDKSSAKKLSKSKGHIVFKDVSFKFGKTVLFSKFSLEVKAGEKVGIVGVSGAGKTTLTDLLLRNHDVNGGAITMDGHDVRDVTRESLRKQIAFVPQDVSLFHRTVLDNIRYGNLKASDSQVVDASKKAQAHEFIKSFPEEYETYVGERGVRLSGGQRQRIAIARAFLKSSPVLVLDEATSALDSESEVLVQAALARLMGNKSVIAIAHRLSTLRIMDRIVVLDKGKIVEEGTHDSLLKKKGVYAKLWNHQVKGFIE
ncbi:ABC transporter ATP-binding protein [Candidatus Peregrinibacteria bacterium CG_4_10_14_0_2_um_filter_38_24]|nr:MAG: ABC transporter ATP-binding protein [Candidatus Peregrinibacteria bacterium CG_4_10_14_0_2_um_filter_38_24]PJC38687.1 MAG: ABC transporter ATP-binding protein [Candidatus Peregrinibacteria bacterium CG_4_9_14_0_2_um_filter_38_9]